MGLVRAAARTAVIAGTATAVSGRVAQRQARRFAAEEQQAAPAASVPEATPTTQRLQELADLHAQGVLSDEEFTAAKAKLLGI